MKIDIHITDCTAKELQSLASWLNDGRRFHVNTYLSKEVKDEEPAPKPEPKQTAFKASRPIVGNKEGNLMRWSSMKACAKYFGKAENTIQRAVKGGHVMRNGWKLYYEDEQDTRRYEQNPEAEVRMPEDKNAPAWSHEPKAITGIAGKEKRHWGSIYQCCQELGAHYNKVKSACLHYGVINGWMLMFDEMTNQQKQQ